MDISFSGKSPSNIKRCSRCTAVTQVQHKRIQLYVNINKYFHLELTFEIHMSHRPRQPQRLHLASCGKGDGQAIVSAEGLGPM